MDNDDLKQGETYTCSELLEYLSANKGQQIFLVSKPGINFVPTLGHPSVPLDQKFFVVKVERVSLHNTGSTYNITNDYKLIYIDPE